ncbi:MAG: FIG01125063: hypothetical protein, partial [uncultured Nocardioidaceae bacterium]
ERRAVRDRGAAPRPAGDPAGRGGPVPCVLGRAPRHDRAREAAGAGGPGRVLVPRRRSGGAPRGRGAVRPGTQGTSRHPRPRTAAACGHARRRRRRGDVGPRVPRARPVLRRRPVRQPAGVPRAARL